LLQRYLQAHYTDVPNAVTSLQLCMGNIDGATASAIKRPEMPEQQAQTLLDPSDLAPRPTA
jgi:hypothetical protein